MSPRVAVVTGAGSGLGRCIAQLLLSEGYSVVLAGRRREALERTAAAEPAAPSGTGRAQVPRPHAVAYTASKHAITGLTRALGSRDARRGSPAGRSTSATPRHR